MDCRSAKFAFKLLFLTLFTLAVDVGFVDGAFAQDTEAVQEAALKEAKKRVEAEEAITTLTTLLKTKNEQENNIKVLKGQLRGAKEEASKQELEAAIKKENEKLAQIEQQISSLTTGTGAGALEEETDKPFNLQGELESLIQPFVKMMKEATENTRQIEELKDTVALAQKRQQVSTRAIDRLKLLISVDKQKKKGTKESLKHLRETLKVWQARKKEAVTLEDTARQQLTLRQEEDSSSSQSMAVYATKFFQERGLNLLLALGAAGLVFLIAESFSRLVNWVRQRQGLKRNFWTRLGAIVFRAFSIVVAFVVMLIIFNVMNDWLLLGVASLFALASAWLFLKMLPQLVEQGTLLLNLGAVQEDERIVIDGVPWRVARLDLYTDLVNPALDGGEFTVPVRELVGLHSRPSGPAEPWFPTKRGDWILYDESSFGQVMRQTPELVQVQDPGGAIVTFGTTAFLEKAPRNLSSGFRLQTEFGLDYFHQAQATTAIPSLLREFMKKGLVAFFGEQSVDKVDVDLLRADDSAIIFEVETIFPGHMAPRYEDTEREIARLLIDACNEHGWTIPFPQFVLHQAANG